MSQAAGGPPYRQQPVVPKASIPRYKAELRKQIRRNAHEHEVNFLNIVAMLDIMTIILVFLLKSLGESISADPNRALSAPEVRRNLTDDCRPSRRP